MNNDKHRRFRIDFSDGDGDKVMELTVSVVETESAVKEIKEMVEFWRGWKNSLRSFEGDYTKTFVDHFSNTIESNKNDLYNLEKLQEFFADFEGFYPVFEKNWFEVQEFWNGYSELELSVDITEL